MPRTRKTRTSSAKRRRLKKRSMILLPHNYVLITIGVLAVVFGYSIMRIENEVDGFLSLYIAPILILGGYLEIIYAILWRNTTRTDSTPDSAQ
ncbi:MAG: hypothetical protein OXE59_04180 [Bacteroidetes bacterium]|nr:hypothetical protein [Bacteroidota bacterium]